jgi:hypothetical protein
MSADPAALMAAVWRASRDEVQLLAARIALLERGVARAMMNPPPDASAEAWAELLAAQRAALDATRARGAIIATLLGEGA